MSAVQHPKRSRLERFAHLPVELWENILHHTSQPSRMRLSWSNRILRQTTMNNPRLWIDFDFPAIPDKAWSKPCTCSTTTVSQPISNELRLLNTLARLDAFLERSQGQPFRVWLNLHRCSLTTTTAQSILRRGNILSRVTLLQVTCWTEDLYTYLQPVGLSRFTSMKTLLFSCSGGAREPNPMLRIVESGILNDVVTKVKLSLVTQWRRSWGPLKAVVQLDIDLLDFHQLLVAMKVMPTVKILRVYLADNAMTVRDTHTLVTVLRERLSRLTTLRVDSSEPVLSWMAQEILATSTDSTTAAIRQIGLYGSEYQDGCLRLFSHLSDSITLQLAIITDLTGLNNTTKRLSITASTATGQSRELRFWLSDVLKDAGWFFRRLLPHLHASQIDHLSIPWTLLQRFTTASGAMRLTRVRTLILKVPVEQHGAAPERVCPMPMLHSITFCCDNPSLCAPLPSAAVRSLVMSLCLKRPLDELDVRGLRTRSWDTIERVSLREIAKKVYGLGFS